LKLVAKNEVFLKIAAAKVEVPMLETQLLGGKFLSPSACDWNCGRLRRTDHLEGARSHFDIARFHVRVPHFRRTRGNLALERNHGLEAELPGALDHIGGRPSGVEGDLDESGAVAKIEKDDSTKVSRAVYPTTEPDCGADVRRSELAAEMGASGRRETGIRGCGGQRWDVWVE